MLLAGVAVMVRDKYAVRLAPEQREELQRLIRVGERPARVTARARILLKSDDGWPAPASKLLSTVAVTTSSPPTNAATTVPSGATDPSAMVVK